MKGLDDQPGKSLDIEKIQDIEESLDSFNAYRVQVNQSLLSLREKLNELELIIADTQKE